ncbi:MAG TPA: hypothetical protein VM368_04745, partial [Flavisolibacter sp.]|nr:hypothetical protein [Flavisolibacter sp.]
MIRKYKNLIVALIIIAGVGVYGYTEYFRTNADLTSVKPDFVITARSLITAFEKDSAAASKQYIDKVLLVKGRMKSIDTSGIIALGDPDEMSSVQCSMDSRISINFATLKEGDEISVQGKCNGYDSDELLGTDV